MISNSNVLDKTKTILNYEIIFSRTTTKLLSISIFVVLTALGAYVRIPLPFTPVPITMQTLFVMLAAVCLGANSAGLSQICYLLLGSLGIPLFSGAASGLSVFMGPTGGYLIGFIGCGYITGRLIRLKDSFNWTIFSVSIGALLILLLGTIWLKIIMNLSFKRAFMAGFAPFIIGDFLKVIAVSSFYKIFKHKFDYCSDDLKNKNLA